MQSAICSYLRVMDGLSSSGTAICMHSVLSSPSVQAATAMRRSPPLGDRRSENAACCGAFLSCLRRCVHRVLMCALICCRFHIQGHSELHLGDINVQHFYSCRQSCLPFRCSVMACAAICILMSAEQQQCLMTASCMSSCATAINGKNVQRVAIVDRPNL